MPREFIYNDSFDPDHQIRLLTLLPAPKLSCTVRCVLEATSFDPIPHYEALSYAWGDANVTKPIIVDDCEFQATENLECGLRYVRHHREPRVLWVDALCIDQKNAHQKNHQVMRMGQIYAKASNVIIWLGAPDETTALAFLALRRLASVYDTLVDVWNSDVQGSRSDAVFVQKCLRGSVTATFSTYARKLCRRPPPILKYAQVYPEQFLGKKATDALIRLCQRAWWKRLWVKQECILSQSFSLVCGRSVLATETASEAFLSFYFLIQMTPMDVYFHFLGDRDVDCDQMRFLFESHLYGGEYSSKRGLLSVLNSMEGDCDDPRDKIFAILSLTDDDNLIAMNPPDYGVGFQHVYSRLAKTWISSKKNLDILNCCLLSASSDPLSYLPSWVPDWRWCQGTCPLIDESFSTSCRVFDASLDSLVDYQFLTKGLEFEILSLGGFCLDVIEELGDSSTHIGVHQKWPSPVIQDWQTTCTESFS